MSDLKKIYLDLCGNKKDTGYLEGLGLALFVFNRICAYKNKINYENADELVPEVIEAIDSIILRVEGFDFTFLPILKACGEDALAKRYAKLLWNFAENIVVADNYKTLSEERYLQKIASVDEDTAKTLEKKGGGKSSGKRGSNIKVSGDTYNPEEEMPDSKLSKSRKTKAKSKGKKTKSFEEGLDELNKLIGIDSVKKEVIKLTNFIKVQRARETHVLS